MQRDPKLLLEDMLKAADVVLQVTEGKALHDLKQDVMIRSTVYWQFTVIGEALARLAKIDESTADSISESRRIIGFRNQVVHGYDIIDHEITWRIISDKLPVLRADIVRLLGQL